MSKEEEEKQQTTASKALDLSADKISNARQYLSLWKTAKDSWKFNKNTQSYILRHMWNKKAIDKKSFKILIKYLKDIKGTARDRLLASANDIIQQCTAAGPGSSDKRKLKRAKKLVKTIR